MRLPKQLHESLLRYQRWQDRQLGLLGKLLLLAGLQQRGYGSDCLDRMLWSAEGRPWLQDGPDFNLSHSGHVVVCAFCSQGRIGVDLEQYRTIDPQDFVLAMSREEMAEIRAADDPSRRLLQLWTAKESAAKAHGLGLGCDFKTIEVENHQLFIENKKYSVQYLNVVTDYLCCLATEVPVTEVRCIEHPIGWSGC